MNASKKTVHPLIPGRNFALAMAMQEIRRSNATRPKPSKTARKQRSRRDNRAAAIRDAS